MEIYRVLKGKITNDNKHFERCSISLAMYMPWPEVVTSGQLVGVIFLLLHECFLK